MMRSVFATSIAALVMAGNAYAQPDTLWLGGVDPATGLAVEGGIWDFEDSTMQGWTSVDLTDVPAFFTHVTADSHAAHGDPASCVITANGSAGSIWCGAHQDYAEERCWPGGQGYSNLWVQHLSKSFMYGGSGDVTLSFSYFVDSCTSWDFTYVYIRNDEGELSGPFNTSEHPNSEGYGYSGCVVDGTNIGTPLGPAHDAIVIPEEVLPDAAGEFFDIIFTFESDLVYSDGHNESAGFYDTIWGPFGVDVIHVQGVGLDESSDFEPTGVPGEEYDGWVPEPRPAIGTLAKVLPLEELDPLGGPDCPLEGCVLVSSDTEPGAIYPHPEGQREYMMSNTIAVGETELSAVLINWDVAMDLDFHVGVCFRVAMNYYPWTCAQTGAVG